MASEIEEDETMIETDDPLDRRAKAIFEPCANVGGYCGTLSQPTRRWRSPSSMTC
jgi:hypothetical protein